jgi:hypothetical protein
MISGFYADEWIHYLPTEMKLTLARGEKLVVGSIVLKLCWGCMTVVQLNKPFFGSTHFCQ